MSEYRKAKKRIEVSVGESIRVSGNWRVTFVFEAGDAYVVDYEDYH